MYEDKECETCVGKTDCDLEAFQDCQYNPLNSDDEIDWDDLEDYARNKYKFWLEDWNGHWHTQNRKY